MSCLEFLGCLLQFMEYLSREKKNLVNVLGEGEGCAYTQGAFLFVSDRSLCICTCSGTCAGGVNGFKCSLFVSAQKLLLWFPIDGNTLWASCAPIGCFMDVVLGSAWTQQWDSPCPGVQCGQEIPGSAHTALQTCCSLLALGSSPAGLPLLQTLPLPQQWSQHRPQISPLHPQFSRVFPQK